MIKSLGFLLLRLSVGIMLNYLVSLSVQYRTGGAGRHTVQRWSEPHLRAGSPCRSRSEADDQRARCARANSGRDPVDGASRGARSFRG